MPVSMVNERAGSLRIKPRFHDDARASIAETEKSIVSEREEAERRRLDAARKRAAEKAAREELRELFDRD